MAGKSEKRVGQQENKKEVNGGSRQAFDRVRTIRLVTRVANEWISKKQKKATSPEIRMCVTLPNQKP